MYVFGENMVKNDEDNEKMERFKFDQSKSGKVLGGACHQKNTFELISELVSVI
jgi:hypothetical protein